jgi:glyoxylase-like metal-dependent hydrolase (beta-lactamase superfamily II)/outer membrane lipoprotein-sorting protein
MKRLLLLVLAALFAGSCATGPSREQDLVGRAIDAMGGADSLARVKTIAVKGTMKQWEPEQSNSPGGEMRFANDAEFTMTGDFTSHAVRVDWVKKFAYPAPRTFTFTEIVTPTAGYVLGREANALNKQASEMNPPAHAMSGLRLATNQRELRRASPSLLLEMRSNPGGVGASPDVTIGGVTYPAASYRAGNDTFIILFDPKTNLPARIRTLDYDNVWGDVTFDLVLSDWRTMGGVRIAASQKYELSGRVIQDVRITDVSTNVQIAAGTFEPPAAVKTGAAKPATGSVPYQWVIRRQFIGTYMDSDSVSFDTRATTSLRLNEIAPGVQHVVGGTHNSLLVEMSDYLIVIDAPVTDWQSNWTIAAAKEKYPNKPIRYLVMTHHHMDHSGGMRAYLAQGATLVVGKGAADHYRKVLAAPFTRNPDLAARNLGGVKIIEVGDKYVISDGKREVSAYFLENPHSTAYLMGYVADARIAYVTDIYSPGPPLPAKINPALASVYNAVKKAGIQPLTVAGGHGSTAPFALLAVLAGK